MCGLIFSYQPHRTPDQHGMVVRTALDRMQHRGPDDCGSHGEGPWHIGHRRLSIIDLAASRQPMSDPTGRYWLAYNGEIYNFQALRAALASRWQFRTSGDTEVLLAGLVTYGESFVRKMEGMWAFALWDKTDATLLLARDRMGKKPLFVQQYGDCLTCASELPTLRVMASFPWAHDADSTADYFRYGYYLPGTTAYKGVFEVLPGHLAKWRPGQTLQQQRYWTLRIGGYEGSRKSAAKCLREALIRAVERRMVADVEVGAFLSGGVDSSLVVGIMTRELGVRPKTFTIGFQEPTFDERMYARMAAQRFQTDHMERVVSRWEVGTLKKLLLSHVGQPFADSSLLPTAAVSEHAAEHVKVALSGDGGDELFSGYQRYEARSLLKWYARLPRTVRRVFESTLKIIPEPTAHHSRSLLKKAHLFADVVDRMDNERPYVAPVMYSSANLFQLLPDLAGMGHAPPDLPQGSQQDEVLEMMTGDAVVYLPQDILVKVDRASMANSLEARAPFLDREVVELAFSLPRSWHRRGFVGKRMLREAFPELLPDSLWRRRKQGFAVPVHDWFRGGLDVELEALLQNVDSPLNGDFVMAMLDMHRRGQRDHGYRLWGIFAYLLFCERENVTG